MTCCGKNCEDCPHQEALSCPGCEKGPGSPVHGDCEIAKCCREKGHKACGTCGFRESCNKLRGSGDMPARRIRAREAEAAKRAEIARTAPFFGKWLWLLFWLIVPGTVASLLENNLTAGLPGLYFTGLVLSFLVNTAYGVILLKLSAENRRYRTAGICCLIGAIAAGLAALLSPGGESSGWTLVITLPAAVVGFVGEYQEYQGHAEILLPVDPLLSGKWELLWKWYIGAFGAMIGSILVVLIIPILGALVLIAAAIAVVVVSIMKLVYLYRTAKLFREYT